MFETDQQKSVLHWKQGSSYIRDRLSQEQSTRRHKWKFPTIFLFRFSQEVDQQTHLQEHAIAFKVPRRSEEPRGVHIKPPRGSISVVDSRKVPHQHVKYLDAVLWKVQKNMWQREQGKMFSMNSLKNSLAWDLLVHTRRVEFWMIASVDNHDLSVLVCGHWVWHGSCEEEKRVKREEFVHAAWPTFEKRKKLFMILYVHCTKEKETKCYIVQASSMLQGLPCPGTTEPIHSSSQGNQKGDKKKQNKTAKLYS